MIDFDKGGFFKLSPIPLEKVRDDVKKMLVEGEDIFAAFKSVRDQLVFTTKRIIAVNVQGITGKKVDYTSIPYSKIQTFSIETAGFLDRDCEIVIWISAIGKLKFEIKGSFDIVGFNQLVARHIL